MADGIVKRAGAVAMGKAQLDESPGASFSAKQDPEVFFGTSFQVVSLSDLTEKAHVNFI